jgi:hypothetical protein
VNLEVGWPVTLALAESERDLCMMGGAGVVVRMAPTIEHAALLRALEVGTVLFIEEGKKQLRVRGGEGGGGGSRAAHASRADKDAADGAPGRVRCVPRDIGTPRFGSLNGKQKSFTGE